MTNIKIVKSVSLKDTFSINSIVWNCIDSFNVNSNFVTDMKVIKDVSSRDAFSINLILWYCGNDISLV